MNNYDLITRARNGEVIGNGAAQITALLDCLDSPRPRTVPAYLIAICDRATHELLSAAIWSSPEWEQSRQLDHFTYVAFAVKAESFEEGRRRIMDSIAQPNSRYHHLNAVLQYNGSPLTEHAGLSS